MSLAASRHSGRADARLRRRLRALVPPRPSTRTRAPHRRPDLRARQIGRARQVETRALPFNRWLVRRLRP